MSVNEIIRCRTFGTAPCHIFSFLPLGGWSSTTYTERESTTPNYLIYRQDTAQQRALREKIEQYQEELAPEATRVFLRVIGLRATDLTSTVSQEITAQEQETEQLAAVATFMKEHLEAMLAMQDHTSLRLEHAIQLLVYEYR